MSSSAEAPARRYRRAKPKPRVAPLGLLYHEWLRFHGIDPLALSFDRQRELVRQYNRGARRPQGSD